MEPFPKPSDVYEDGPYQEIRNRVCQQLRYHGEFKDTIELYDPSEGENIYAIYSIICEEARAEGWQAECTQHQRQGRIPPTNRKYEGLGIRIEPAIVRIGTITTIEVSITQNA
jgi:hypothetical protein